MGIFSSVVAIFSKIAFMFRIMITAPPEPIKAGQFVKIQMQLEYAL